MVIHVERGATVFYWIIKRKPGHCVLREDHFGMVNRWLWIFYSAIEIIEMAWPNDRGICVIIKNIHLLFYEHRNLRLSFLLRFNVNYDSYAQLFFVYLLLFASLSSFFAALLELPINSATVKLLVQLEIKTFPCKSISRERSRHEFSVLGKKMPFKSNETQL